MLYRVIQKKRAPILIILNTRGPFFLGHPVYTVQLCYSSNKCTFGHVLDVELKMQAYGYPEFL